MTNTEKIFVTNIKMLRESKDLKIFNIATICNNSNGYCKSVENGGKELSLIFITKLSAFYNIPIYEFFKENINIHNCGSTENVEIIFAKNLIMYRKKKEWTTYRFAKEIGVTSQYLYKLEGGSARRLKFEFLERLASLLDAEVYQLFMPERAERKIDGSEGSKNN